MGTPSNYFLYLQKRLLELSDVEKKVNYNDAKVMLATARNTKTIACELLKELQRLKLIKINKQIKNREIEIINLDQSDCVEIFWKNDSYDRKKRKVIFKNNIE